MFVIIGWVVALLTIFIPYLMSGGMMGPLVQPGKFIMIFGAAFGAAIAASNMVAFKHMMSSIASCFKGSKYTKTFYMELLALLFALLAKARKDGLMSLEGDVDAPDKSAIFTKFPLVTAHPHIVEFITDYLRLMVGGNLGTMEIENLMDIEIETHHHEEMHASHSVGSLADSLPAFGIVAAVMGIVVTMGSLHLPPSELGALIGKALVGAFLGILLGYAFMTPLAKSIETKANESVKVLQTIKVVLLSSVNGFAPTTCVEFGRKVLFLHERPSFSELEEDIKARKGK
jgi:chemotaxis protein MotA